MSTWRTAVLALVVVVAACGGGDGTATTTHAPPPTASSGTLPVDLVATCGAVTLPGGLSPRLPDQPLTAEAAAALEQAIALVPGEEGRFFEQHEWTVAEQGDDRIVLFGRPVPESVDGGYASASFVRQGDRWRPEGWGQCRVSVSAPGFGPAAWVLDPDREPEPAGTRLHLLANERACASGSPPEGRQVVPVTLPSPESVAIVVLVEPVEGAATCQSNPWFPLTVALEEPWGGRDLFDASSVPPLRRPWPPTEESLSSMGSQE